MADDDVDDHMALREQYWPLLVKALDEATDPVQTADLFVATNEVAMISYDALPLIGTAAMAAHRAAMQQPATPDQPQGAAANDQLDLTIFFNHRGTFQSQNMSVLEMKARQQAWAVLRTQNLWRRAWDEAHAGG